MRYFILMALALGLTACQSGDKSKDMKKDMKDTKAKVEKTVSKAKKKMADAKAVSGDATCSLGAVKREIAIVKSDAGCSVQYTKDGTMSEVAKGSTGSDYCGTVAAKIRSNLEKNGFKCQ